MKLSALSVRASSNGEKNQRCMGALIGLANSAGTDTMIKGRSGPFCCLSITTTSKRSFTAEHKRAATMTEEFTKQKLWGGRFTGRTDPLMHEYNQSLSYDQRMWSQDIRGSQAYAKALVGAGVLSQQESDEIVAGLARVGEEWEKGAFQPAPDDEDIHTANERRLKELIGSVAGKLHTGRSRNDQVATDMRLWLLDTIGDITSSLKGLLDVMLKRAASEADAVMPGYTHLQRAQPIRWSHLLLSHATYFANDFHRLRDLIPRISVLPLGSGPLAGNPFAQLDRDFLAKELGFQTVGTNSMHSVSDRDFVAEFLMWASLTMIHMSKMAEDLIIYSSAEFGFVQLSDAYSYVSARRSQCACEHGMLTVCLRTALGRRSCRKRKTLTRWSCCVARAGVCLGR